MRKGEGVGCYWHENAANEPEGWHWSQEYQIHLFESELVLLQLPIRDIAN